MSGEFLGMCARIVEGIQSGSDLLFTTMNHDMTKGGEQIDTGISTEIRAEVSVIGGKRSQRIASKKREQVSLTSLVSSVLLENCSLHSFRVYF
jgi:hypothetical protein